MNENRPIVGITMGDPVGVGPEIICQALSHKEVYDVARPLVIGDVRILEGAKKSTRTTHMFSMVNVPHSGTFRPGCIDVLNASNLDPMKIAWANPTKTTGKAMIDYIEHAVDLALRDEISAMVTCPINKTALKMAGSSYPGQSGPSFTVSISNASIVRPLWSCGEKLKMPAVPTRPWTERWRARAPSALQSPPASPCHSARMVW